MSAPLNDVAAGGAAMKRALSTLVSVIAVAMLLATLQATTPPYAMLTGPILTTGKGSEAVASTSFSVQVKRIVKANTIAYDQFGRDVELRSSGVWIVVSAELHAFQETMPVRAATLTGASGRLYRESQRAGSAPNVVAAKTIQPGLPTTGIFAFELPEDETQDMKLLVSEQYDPQLTDKIAVSLDANSIESRERLEIVKDCL